MDSAGVSTALAFRDVLMLGVAVLAGTLACVRVPITGSAYLMPQHPVPDPARLPLPQQVRAPMCWIAIVWRLPACRIFMATEH